MSTYQVIARKYRPKSFEEVIGQDAIVTTLKNAIKNERLAHAYLFCGSRGTGKTTLARVFAKALNCQSPTPSGEPCNVCSTCKEINSGHSLDVLEIDGASHRGIDDIRQINETVGYASACGKYKIYIIDEVHMLTKEAFNALLKTLEEPPAKVIFLFATTEPHKVLPTILSRCQRFNLNRISIDKIILKLKRIATELNVEVDEAALHLLAQRAEGGLRDAESLFDQIIAFHEGAIDVQMVADALGVMPKDILFRLDQAGKEGNLSIAFDISHQIFSQGKDINHFVESLTEHFRTLLLIKFSGISATHLNILDSDKIRYEASAKLYTQEQCLTILDFLVEAQNNIRFQPSARIALETILLRIMRIHQRLPVEFLVRRLAELEQLIKGDSPTVPPIPEPEPISETKPEEKIIVQAPKSAPIPQPQPMPAPKAMPIPQPPIPAPIQVVAVPPPPPSPPKPQPVAEIKIETPVATPPNMSKQSRYDTIMQFAAVELEGTIQKK